MLATSLCSMALRDLLDYKLSVGPVDRSDLYSASTKWDVSIRRLALLISLNAEIFNWESRRLYLLEDLGIDFGSKDENDRYVLVWICCPANSTAELRVSKKFLGRPSLSRRYESI